MDEAKKVVLFVCQGNTFRSVMAEAIFNASAPEGWRAESAGVEAGERTSAAALDLLREIGVIPSSLVPRTVTTRLIDNADRLVVFGCGPGLPNHDPRELLDWPVPGGMDKSPKERELIRDEIRARVKLLISNLGQSST